MSDEFTRFPHQRLDAYRVALRLVKGVEDLARTFPRGHGENRDQLRRAASATVRHIAEAAGRTHPRDKAARFMVARGEVAECAAVLEMAHVLDLADAREIIRLRGLAARVSAMLLGLVRAERRYAAPGEGLSEKSPSDQDRARTSVTSHAEDAVSSADTATRRGEVTRSRSRSTPGDFSDRA